MLRWIIFWLLAVNIGGAIVTAIDKSRARQGRWRISERTLYGFCLLGGCPGVYLTMKVIHHKTKHARFMLGIPLIFLAQLAICGYLWYHWFH